MCLDALLQVCIYIWMCSKWEACDLLPIIICYATLYSTNTELTQSCALGLFAVVQHELMEQS